MTNAIHALLSECVTGKAAEDHVFTRSNGVPVRDFRAAWVKAAQAAGVTMFSALEPDLRVLLRTVSERKNRQRTQ
jgi:hypothetical protein